MKVPSILLFVCLSALRAQTPQTQPATPMPAPPPKIPDLPDDTAVAVFDDGTRFTVGDFKKIYAALPPENQQMALRERRLFLQQWGLMRKLAQMAEKEKLDQASPVKESLDYARMMILSQAELNDQLGKGTVEPGEIVKYYDVNKEKYKVVKVKAIYIAFSDDPPGANSKGKKPLTDAQAKAKAAGLLARVRSGTDFVSLVKDNSDDETSRNKNGDFITLRPNDNVPDAVRTAVFALKKGEVSEPVRQQSGYYLLMADDITYRPLSQVRDEIFSELKQQHYAEWLDKTNRDNKVTFTSPEFLGLTPMAPITVKK
ncbi:MAG TPA: peptidylprolyl isomerase [Bryobacteraceae bacterium]|nr:peptidylprolyl isomerase [Bryobacteraceae bacterium]